VSKNLSFCCVTLVLLVSCKNSLLSCVNTNSLNWHECHIAICTVLHAVYACVVCTLKFSTLLAILNGFDGYANSIKYNFGYYVHRISEVALVFCFHLISCAFAMFMLPVAWNYKSLVCSDVQWHNIHTSVIRIRPASLRLRHAVGPSDVTSRLCVHVV